jgi:hypothetical protein
MKKTGMNIIKARSTYIHGIDLSDFYPCHNLSFTTQFVSSYFSALIDPGLAEVHQSAQEVSMEYLRTEGLPPGVMTPRALWCITAAAWIRKGINIGIGVPTPQFLSKLDSQEIVRKGNIEIEFERVRREIAPDASSRLACIWVAEDTDTGREHVKSKC